MFRYIKEILMAISPAQRLWALSLLLFSIALISIGPKIVESFTSSDSELQSINERQKTQILLLNSELNKLNSDIIQAKTECTDLVIKRESEILSMVNELMRGVSASNNKLQKIEQDYQIIGKDTILIDRVQPKVIDDNKMPMVLDGLNKIKNKIQKDLENQK